MVVVPEAEVEPKRLASSRKAAKLIGPDSTALFCKYHVLGIIFCLAKVSPDWCSLKQRRTSVINWGCEGEAK